MRLALLSAVAKVLRIRFKVDGMPYGASAKLVHGLNKARVID
jgi:hypothetical protein